MVKFTRCWLVLVCVALAAGCRNETASSRETRQAPASTPRDGGTLVRRLIADAASLNPVRASSKHERYVHKYLFTPVLYLDRDLEPVPGLAKSWTVSADGLVYHFELNEKATFSDGTPVRASDVLFTLRKIIDPKVQAPQVAGFFEELDLSRSRVSGDHSIDVVFRTPLAHQLLHFADVHVVPEHVYSEGDFNNDFNDNAVGSGPYKLVKRDRGKQIVVERRTDYWREKPHIQTIIFQVIADHGTAWNALKSGELDETLVSSDTWSRERTNAALQRTMEFQQFYRLGYNFIAWNNQNRILADKRVRRALAMCIPVDAMIRDLFHGTARAISGPFTPGEYAFNPSVPMIRFDPFGARRMFAEAGWTDRNGDGILEKGDEQLALEMLVIAGSAATNQFMQTLQAETKKVGVRLEIRAIDGAAFSQQVRAGNFDAAYAAWELDADPDPHSFFHTTQFPPAGQNIVRYSNPEVDRLIDAARRELDPKKRKALYWRLHQVLADDQPYAWAVQVAMKWAHSRRLHGVELSPAEGLFFWYPGELAWWLDA